MSVAGTLLHFGLNQLFDVSTKEIVDWVESRFADSSRRPIHAVITAHGRAWQVVGLALSEETFAGKLRNTVRDGDLKGACQQFLEVIAATPNGLGVSGVFLHQRAAAELLTLRGRTFANTALEDAAGSLRRFSDPAALCEELLQTSANVAVELTDAPHLAAMLQLAPERVSLFESMCRHFFRALVAKDEDLSRRLTHDQLRALTAAVDTRTSGILDQFDVLFESLAKIEVKVDAGFAGMNEKLTDIQARLAARKDGVSYDNDREREFLRRARDAFRRNPDAVRPNEWGRLGDALREARLYAEAGEAHATAAATACAVRDVTAEAANHHAQYLDACASGKWDVAFASLWKAVELDEARYQPFPVYFPNHPVLDRGRYEPLRILGGGAFGTVFLCRDHNNPDPDTGALLQVAIKTLRAEALSRDLQKVLAEAITLKALKHASVIGILDQGFADRSRTRPYLVLEYFPGQTLETWLRDRGVLAPEALVVVARLTAAAVHAAHTRSKPVFHRDLKPANIMVLLNADGTWDVRVIDFGLAVRGDVMRTSMNVPQAQRSTADKSVTGTIKYAPPEQLGELPGVEVGPYSDVYSFGKTCLELLFRTTSPKKWDWARVPADLRDPLQELFERCTADALEHRFANFEPVLAALTALDPAEKATRKAREEAQRRQEENARIQREREEAERKNREAEERRQREEAERKRQEETERKRREEEAERKRIAEEEARKRDPFHPGRVRAPGDKVRMKLPGDVPITFAWCPPGNFRMGSEHPEAVKLSYSDRERPVHSVRLSQGFFMGIHPVTRGQFAKFVEATGYKTEAETGGGGHRWDGKKSEWVLDASTTWRNPGFKQNDDHPVTVVSWNDAQAFAKWLHKLSKRTVRLPTEAEWEYACRAGTTTEYHFGDFINTDQVNYDGNYSWNGSPKGKWREQTTPVGSFPANPWGLFDVHGNVWEWCEDWYGPYSGEDQVDPCRTTKHSDEFRVLRGGAWDNNPGYCRAACRSRFGPANRNSYYGFRVCFRLD